MPSVTQLIPNYLGGVSKQTDDKKKPGQVNELNNAMPDITYGLLKRSGFRFTRNVVDSEGANLDNGKWFFIPRGNLDAYIGVITEADQQAGTTGTIRVWNAITGIQSVVQFPDGTGYLDIFYNDTTGIGPEQLYSTTTIQDETNITNTIKIVTAEPAPTTYVADTKGTVKITLVEYGADYTVTINGTEATIKTRNFDDETDPAITFLNATEILDDLKTAIDAESIADLTVTVLSDCLELSFANNTTFTELNAVGGIGNSALNAYITDVVDVSFLASESVQGRTVQILNASGDLDDYWLTFDAEDGVSGPGSWIESRDPGVSPGFDASTMPHTLILDSINAGVATFIFKEIDWTDRLAGDEVTNPQPSFVGNAIQYTFFYSNRFGILSEDNVILSQANDPRNFFRRSAQALIDSDPIDINVSSVNPVRLISCRPEPQGLILFSSQEQFRLFSFDTALTPTTSQIRSLSKYEIAPFISPESLGTSIAFISKVPSYTRCYLYETRGLEENPSVVDIGKTVSQWLPGNITGLTTSPQNSLIALFSSRSKEVHLYRYYNNGEKDLFQAWTKWTMVGNVVALQIINDQVITVTNQNDGYILMVNDLNENRSTNIISNNATFLDERIWSNPYLDLTFTPADGTISYDFINNQTSIDLPYTNVDGLTPCVLLCAEATGDDLDIFSLNNLYQPLTTNPQDLESGYFATPIINGNTWILEGDWTDDRERIVCGYRYEYTVELPKIYYNAGENKYDYTAILTIARERFSIAFTGAVQFSLQTLGRSEWNPVYSVTDADYYLADSGPLVLDRVFTVPVYQQNRNYKLKVDDTSPFPTSLTSMMWEGNYVPRFYSRKIT